MKSPRVTLTLGVITTVLLTPPIAQASLTGLSCQEVDFSAGFIFADGSIDAFSAAVVGAAWSAVNVTTYRVWADVSSSLDTVTTAGSGGAGQPLIINSNDGAFFNSTAAAAGDHPSAIIPGFLFSPDLAWDSWLTIGGASLNDISSPISGDFTDTNPASWGGLTGNVNASNTEWALTSDTSGAVSDGAGGFRILLGQFTVATTGSEGINGWMRVQGFSGGVPFDEYLPFHQVPGPGVFLLFMLAGTRHRRSRSN